MADLPNITQGTRWDDIPARQWRRLIDIVERVGDLHAQHPLQVIETGQGVRIQFDRPFDPVLPKTRRVAIVQEINSQEDKTIVVRGVRYAPEAPPRGQRDDLIEQPTGRYEWTDKFEAYPEIGFTIDHYQGFVWTEERPSMHMLVLTARREHDVWLLEQPAHPGVMWCYISRIPNRDLWDTETGVGPRFIPRYLFVRPLVLRPQPEFGNRTQYFISETELYARIYPASRATTDLLELYVSLIRAPGFWTGVPIPPGSVNDLPILLHSCPDLGDGAVWELLR